MIAKLKAYAMGLGIFVLTLIGLYWKGRHDGRTRERQRVNSATAEKVISVVEKKRDIENNNRSLDAAARRQRLRDSLKTTHR